MEGSLFFVVESKSIMLFYLFSDYHHPLASSLTQKVYRLYDVSNTTWGNVIQSVSKICVPGGPPLKTVSSLLVIDGIGQLSLVYEFSPVNEVCSLLSPSGDIVLVRITTDRATQQTVWIGFSERYPLRAFLPFDPSLTIKEGFYTVLRCYRYVLSPSLVDTVRPMIESQEATVPLQPMYLQFNYFEWLKTQIKGGPLGFGHDQYATYWNFPNEQVGDFLALRIIMEDISHTNYFSLSYGNPIPQPPLPPQSLPYGYTDVDSSITFYVDGWNPKRPMIFPNPYYFPTPPRIMAPKASRSKRETPLQGNVNVYRLDRETSASIEGDGYVPGECLTTYLFSLVTNATSIVPFLCSTFDVLHPYGLMQMRIPVSCYENAQYYQGCGIPDIDLQYWSVGSHLCAKQTDFLPFWTVNAKLMNDLQQEYGYVVWAPYKDVVPLVTPGSTSPPVITIGKQQNIKAYVLQTPTLAFIFRYRQIRADWSGNPVRAPCLNTLKETLAFGAITDQLTGDDGIQWCPQLLADDSATTWEEFLTFLDNLDL